MQAPVHSTKNKTSQYIYWISLSGIIIITSTLIGTFYFEAKTINSDAAWQQLLRNTVLTSVFIIIFSFLLKHFINKMVGLVREKEKAENKAAIKDKFLSTMSHEIRTPMNAVVGLSNILLQENPRNDQVENLQTLKFSADLLLSLINDILDYSKIEAGKIEIEKIRFDLLLVVSSIRNALRTKADEQGIQLQLNIDQDIPQFVIGDQVRLSQVLTNLIGNAIKFTTKGSVTISLKLIQQEAQQYTIRFIIKDTGIGIPKDKFQKIFNSFSQAETNTTRKFGGTGLGLSITKRLLELQDSSIQLESEVGKGSTFYFDLTFEKAIQETNQPKAVVQKSKDFEIFNQENILLVEDNKINVMVAKKFLSKWNLCIDVAENGAIALDKIKEKNYDLVLMDLNMPVMDGYTTTQEIRKMPDPIYQKLPIIALSASAIDGFRRKAFEAGMTAFVTKPFNPEELYQTLANYIRAEVTAGVE